MILADLALRTTAILAAALVATLVLRRGTAATRHLVWTLAAAGMLALPILAAALPSWNILPSIAARGVPLDAHGTGERPSRAHILNDCATRSDGNERRPCAATRIDQTVQRGESGEHALDANVRETAAAHPAADGGRALALAANVALAVWLLVASVMLARIVAGILAVRRLARHARPADPRSRAMLDDIVRRIGVGAPIRLLVSRDVSTPITWGATHPLLLLPVEARGWCDDRIHMVLLHEVAHIRRADWLSHLAGRIALACYWFNPLAWLAVRAMTRERERACDDFVVLQGSPATDYAQHLLDIARSAIAEQGLTVAPAMARRSELEGRLLSILTPHHRESHRCTSMALTLAAAAAAVCIATAAPAPGPVAPTPQPGQAEARSAPEPQPAPVPKPSLPTAAAQAKDHEEARQSRTVRRVLVDAMHDASEDVREKATLGLALQSGNEVVAALIGALKDPSSQVREKAALGLAFRRQPAVVDALLAAAHDDDSQVREKVVFALGVSGDRRVLPALIAAAKDPDAQVREKAVHGLATLSAAGEDEAEDARLIGDAVRSGIAGVLSALSRR